MKWFTRGWHAGEFSDAEAERIKQSYWDHVRELTDQLEPSVAQLARETNLHDAVIEGVHVYGAEQRLIVSLVVGDNQGGCRAIHLEYLGMEIGSRGLDTLRQRVLDRETEILYDEVDVEPDGGFVHRLLFWPEGEISIWFKHLEISSAARTDCRVKLGAAFVKHD